MFRAGKWNHFPPLPSSWISDIINCTASSLGFQVHQGDCLVSARWRSMPPGQLHSSLGWVVFLSFACQTFPGGLGEVREEFARSQGYVESYPLQTKEISFLLPFPLVFNFYYFQWCCCWHVIHNLCSLEKASLRYIIPFWSWEGWLQSSMETHFLCISLCMFLKKRWHWISVACRDFGLERPLISGQGSPGSPYHVSVSFHCPLGAFLITSPKFFC